MDQYVGLALGVDFRLDANDFDKPHILEINPLPGLNPDYSDLVIEARADGWRYEKLVNSILHEALERQQVLAEGMISPLGFTDIPI